MKIFFHLNLLKMLTLKLKMKEFQYKLYFFS